MIDFVSKYNKPILIGADECGTGSWVGPLVVCAVKAPSNWSLEGLNDSKKLSRKKRALMRDKLNSLIEKKEIEWCLAERSHSHIDQNGMAFSLKDAYVEVFKKLYQTDALIIVDGTLKFTHPDVATYDIVSLIRADAQVPAVMAASILGKTYRDEKLSILGQLYPEYDWQSNAGYSSAKHKQALSKHGMTPLHRHSYNIKL